MVGIGVLRLGASAKPPVAQGAKTAQILRVRHRSNFSKGGARIHYSLAFTGH
jgi:hypothetical protein